MSKMTIDHGYFAGQEQAMQDIAKTGYRPGAGYLRVENLQPIEINSALRSLRPTPDLREKL